MAGKVGEDFIYTFAVEGNNGARTGLGASDFMVIVRNPDDDASSTPSVSEVGAGQYRFTIPAAFSNTHGAGQYGITVELDASSPNQKAIFGDTLEFFVSDFDDLATSVEVTALLAVLNRVDGLVGNNNVLTALTKNSNGDMLTGRVRLYDSQANAILDNGVTGLLDTYAITASYDLNNTLNKFTISRDGS